LTIWPRAYPRHRVERIFRDVRAFRVYEGPSEMHRFALCRRIVEGKIDGGP
jgi:alkylation response protein AidB-like acyl-CoA dehydrogenase